MVEFFVNLCLIPNDATIETSLTGMDSVHNDMKERKLQSPDYMTLAEV